MVELDYGGAARLFSDGELATDETAEEVAASLRALNRGDYDAAGEHYGRVAARWAHAQVAHLRQLRRRRAGRFSMTAGRPTPGSKPVDPIRCPQCGGGIITREMWGWVNPATGKYVTRGSSGSASTPCFLSLAMFGFGVLYAAFYIVAVPVYLVWRLFTHRKYTVRRTRVHL